MICFMGLGFGSLGVSAVEGGESFRLFGDTRI